MIRPKIEDFVNEDGWFNNIQFMKQTMDYTDFLEKKLIEKPEPRIMKSEEVMELLGISAGTLQTLRKNKTIPYTKVGGILFYDKDEILEIVNIKYKR